VLHQPLEDIGDIRPGQPVEPPLARGADRDQPAFAEFLQVGASCGMADAGLLGQPAGRELAPWDQGDQDPAPSPIRHQLGDPR
jgi:hypothetical protein